MKRTPSTTDLDLESVAQIYYILQINIFVNFKILNETSIITEFSTVHVHDKLLLLTFDKQNIFTMSKLKSIQMKILFYVTFLLNRIHPNLRETSHLCHMDRTIIYWQKSFLQYRVKAVKQHEYWAAEFVGGMEARSIVPHS